MNVKQLISQLSNLKEELQLKDVTVVARNGLLLPAEIKFRKKDEYNRNLTDENVSSVVITHD